MVTVTTQCFLSVIPSSSHFSPAPAWAFHGLLPFMKKICPSMGSSSTIEQREDFMCLLLPPWVFPVLFLTPFCYFLFPLSSSLCSRLSQGEAPPSWLRVPAVPCGGAVGAGCGRHGAAPALLHAAVQQRMLPTPPPTLPAPPLPQANKQINTLTLKSCRDI